MDDGGAASELRREIEAEGGELYLAVSELRDQFSRSRLTVKARGEIEAALRGAGIFRRPAVGGRSGSR